MRDDAAGNQIRIARPDRLPAKPISPAELRVRRCAQPSAAAGLRRASLARRDARALGSRTPLLGQAVTPAVDFLDFAACA